MEKFKEKNNKFKNVFNNLNKNYELFNLNYNDMFNKLVNSNLKTIALNTESILMPEKKIKLYFYNEIVVVDCLNKQVIKYNSKYNSNITKIDSFSSSLILHFLITANNKPLSGSWISYRELPDGLFYASTIPAVLAPLIKKYENNGLDFIKKIISLGGKKEENFKNAAIIFPFKKFPILFILEEKDEEFEANIKVLFDKNSSYFMKTDIIKTLLVYTVKKLLS